jgi:hypothetical protein
MITLKQVREGSIVMVRGGFGIEPATRAKVTRVERDIKNGFPGIDYKTMDGKCFWAYIDQVERVVTY